MAMASLAKKFKFIDNFVTVEDNETIKINTGNEADIKVVIRDYSVNTCQMSVIPRSKVLSHSSSINQSSSSRFSKYLDSEFGVDTIDELDYDTFFSSSRIIKKTSVTWRLYHPVDDDSFYGQILNSPDRARDIALNFVFMYKENPDMALRHIIRFCLDLCGYQKMKLDASYFDQNNKKFLNDIMQEMNHPLCGAEVFHTRKYLFGEKDSVKVAYILKMGIFNFIQKLILQALENDFFNIRPFHHFIQFLLTMMQSDVIPIFYAGGILSIKVLTALCMKKENCNKERVLSDPYVDKYIAVFYAEFRKYSLRSDNKLKAFRTSVIKEMFLWIKMLPDTFLNKFNCFEIISHLLNDKEGSVRELTVLTCIRLIENLEFPDSCDDNLLELLSDINKRLFDINMKVTIRAFDMYEAVVACRPDLIRGETFRLFVRLIYDKYYIYAKRSGMILLKILELNGNDSLEVIVRIHKTYRTPHENPIPHLVEALIDDFPELTNWAGYITILERNLLSIDDTICLCETLLEAAHQNLFGVSTKTRAMSRKDMILKKNHEKIALQVIPKIKKLLCQYHASPEILVILIELVTKIKVYDVYHQDYNQILQVVFRIFTVNHTVNLLHTIADMFKYLDNEIKQFYALPKKNMQPFFWFYRQKFNNIPTQNGVNMDHKINVEMYEKCEILLSRFDLLDNIQVTWTNFIIQRGTTPRVVSVILKCCKWMLIWNLKRQYHQTITTISEIDFLTMRNQLLDEFGRYLQAPSLEVNIVAFTELHDFSKSYTEALKQLCTVKAAYKSLEIHLKYENSNRLRSLILNFFENKVLLNAYVQLDKRRKLLIYFINLTQNYVIPVTFMLNVLQHFDRCYTDYGKIIESYIKTVALLDVGLWPLLIVETLIKCYKNVMPNLHITNGTSKNGMKALVERFISCKEVQQPNTANCVLQFSIDYAKKTDQFPFCVNLEAFVPFTTNLDTLKELRNQFADSNFKRSEKHVGRFCQKVNIRIANLEQKVRTFAKDLVKMKDVSGGCKLGRKKGRRKNKNKRHYDPNDTDTSDPSDIMSIHDSSDNISEFSDLSL